jgi:ribose transport system substrate-binding protein
MSANWHQQGVLIANYMIWKSNGHLDTLMTYLPDNIADTVGQFGGGHEVLTDKTKCPDCTVHVLTVTEATLSTATGPGTVAGVQADPKIDWLYLFDYGLGLQFNALQTAGLLRSDIKGAGFDCLAQNLAWIKQGYHQAVCLADPRIWEAWAAVDAANRMMQGQQPYTVGHLAGSPSNFPNYDVPLLLVDKDNVGSLTADDLANGWQGGAIDFRSHYLKLWGVQ